ncbi:anti-sigma regulatory factor [Halorientalis brevis]|uniref:Anti-sigma regulatory factor n=1 Tax=Halorientalis brevis TaxID=1126241 RepID=A0ABD6CE56_9EURY|nr:anti-sigma regulatory factor [Halorientalis brevis]
MNERTESAAQLDGFDGDVLRSGSVQIQSENDILQARKTAREIAQEIGFSITDVTRTVTAVSELARNIHLYADEGVMEWSELQDGSRSGIELTFDDDGPGIDDVEGVLRAEYSTSDGMGRGIQGTKKLMDEFGIASSAAKGTTVTIRKWLK